MNWQEFEKQVRMIASVKWSRPANKETINGIELDCVLRIDDSNYIIIQITQNETLDKFRKDLLDIDIIRRHFFDEYININSYIITEDEISSRMQETANKQRVNALTFKQFAETFFNYQSYYYERQKKPFGSAVIPLTGEKENNKFVKVKYKNINSGELITFDNILKLLNKKKTIIMKGEYGTGKSRLIQSLFDDLENKHLENIFTLAIDLRDYPKIESDDLLIRRHFRKYGLGHLEDSAIKCLNNSMFLFLIDGFDEISSQSWSENPLKLKELRYQEFGFLRSLKEKANNGLLITGREHYFNDDEEMIKAFDLKTNEYIILESRDEFTNEEIDEYCSDNKINISMPSWLPKKPMVLRLISENIISNDLELAFKQNSPLLFWDLFFDYIAERDYNANKTVLDPDTIKKLLIELAHLTRFTENNNGPISLENMSLTFKNIFGYEAIDQSAAYLQRLPGMGRIKSDTYDRRFTDDYFLDYLRVKKIESEVLETINCRNDKWKNILSKNGLLLLAEAFKNLNVNGLTVLHKIKDCQNCNLILEIFSSSLFIGENDNIDCKDITFEYGECSFLDLSNTEISNFKMNYCDIYELNLTNSKLSNCFIENTSFGKIFGLSSKTGLPKYFDKSCSYSEFQQISSISKIKSVTLKPSQQYLVLIIQKVFNQKGSGKKEEVLTRGFQGIYNKKMAKDILNLLIKNDILFTHPGDEGLIYKGNRKQQPRMEKILEELTLSKDELWEKVSKMK